MHPFYLELCADLGWQVDEALAKSLDEACAAKLVKLDEKIEDATLNSGETEIRDAMVEKAEYYALIGDKVRLCGHFVASFLLSRGGLLGADECASLCRR